MEFNIIESNNQIIAEVISDKVEISNIREALDLMANADYQGARKIIIHEKNFHPGLESGSGN